MLALRIALLTVALLALTGSTADALDLEVDVQPPPGEVGTPYEFEFQGEEGCLPYRFSYLNGTVPPGLEITEDGRLTGTPTQAGTFGFWVALDDNGGPSNPYCPYPSVQSQGEFTMVVMPDLAVTTTSLPAAISGMPYSAQLEFSNPEPGWRVVWDITTGSLPAGLTLSESGVIAGTPTSADSRAFTVRAREPFRRFGERGLTLRVADALQARSSLGPGEVGLTYAGSIPTRGGAEPLSWSIANGSLPRGLTLDGGTGSVRGLPGEAGTFQLTFAVSDSTGQAVTVPASLRVAPRLAVTTRALRPAAVGAPYRERLKSTGGLGPKRWRIADGRLPRGLRLKATGLVSGVARRPGVFRFKVEARDRLGGRARKALRLLVRR